MFSNKQWVVLVLALAAAVLVAADKGERREKHKKDMEECKAETGATDEDTKVFKKMGDESSPEAKCFVGCMYEKFGLLVNGAFNKEHIMSWITKKMPGDSEKQERAAKFADQCEQELAGLPADKCVTGPKLRQCIHKAMKQWKEEKKQE